MILLCFIFLYLRIKYSQILLNQASGLINYLRNIFMFYARCQFLLISFSSFFCLLLFMFILSLLELFHI